MPKTLLACALRLLGERLRGRTVLAYRDNKSFMNKYATQREVAYGVLEADLTDRS